MPLSREEIERQLQNLHEISEKFALARFRQALWAELDAWWAARSSADWGPCHGGNPPNPPDRT
jgi:hypothetical protein